MSRFRANAGAGTRSTPRLAPPFAARDRSRSTRATLSPGSKSSTPSATARRSARPRFDRQNRHVHIGEVGMRVAVLGAGNGGVASAFDFAQHGHEVSLYATPEFGTTWSRWTRPAASPRAAISRASPRSATPGTTPPRRWPAPSSSCSSARRTAPSRWPPLAAPHLTDGMAVLVCPGSCAGAIAFKRAAGLELDDDRYRRRRDQHAAVRGADHRAGRHQRLPQAHDRRLPRRAPAQRGRTGCTTSSRTSGRPSRRPRASSRPRSRTATR